MASCWKVETPVPSSIRGGDESAPDELEGLAEAGANPLHILRELVEVPADGVDVRLDLLGGEVTDLFHYRRLRPRLRLRLAASLFELRRHKTPWSGLPGRSSRPGTDVDEEARLRSGLRRGRLRSQPRVENEAWWSRTGSNRRPPECHSGALPTELRPHRKALCSKGGGMCQSSLPLNRVISDQSSVIRPLHKCNEGRIDVHFSQLITDH